MKKNNINKIIGTSTLLLVVGLCGSFLVSNKINNFNSINSINNDIEQNIVKENITQTSKGPFHSAAITNEGELYTWGRNDDGQLGNGNKRMYYTPKQVDIDDVKEVSLGARYSIALTTSGEVYTWGLNNYGQLGLGNYNQYSEPQKVFVGDDKTVVESISAGSYTGGAITESKELYMWGANNFGQVGINSGDEKIYNPNKVEIIDNDGSVELVKDVSVGNHFTLAITEANDVWGWGINDKGQLPFVEEGKVLSPKKIY